MRSWNPLWRHPYESLWSIANKLAFVAAVSVLNALVFLLGTQVQRRRSLVWTGTEESVANLCTRLELEADCIDQMFLDVEPPSKVSRANLSLGVRWCPECLAQGFHCAEFQDARLLKCPAHGCTLENACPKCRWPLDPLMSRAWVCSSCGQALYVPPRGWPAAFREPVLFAPNRWEYAYSEKKKASDGHIALQLHATDWLPALSHSDAPLFAKSLAAFAAFEESCELFDYSAPRLHAAAGDEVLATELEFSRVKFGEPVAAAMNHVAAWFGCATEALAGHWPRREPSFGHPNLSWYLGQAPPWARHMVARALYRDWVISAAQDFELAQLYNRAPSWRPPDEIPPNYLVSATGQVFFTKPRWAPSFRVQPKQRR